MDILIEKYPEGRFNMIFADPPYFLSNGGITCHASKRVKVDKGQWDQSQGAELNHQFNLAWLSHLVENQWNALGLRNSSCHSFGRLRLKKI